LQAAQDVKFSAMQQERNLHHAAFSFSWHPGQLSLRYFLHAPQYKPQYATRFGFDRISFIFRLHFF
jgi:hypothetical protein